MTKRSIVNACAALILFACGGKVIADEKPAPISGSDCVAACTAQFPFGAQMFWDVGNLCLCDGCDDACAQSLCSDRQPTDACLPCLQAGFFGDHCMNHEGLFDFCYDSNTECDAFAMCMEACPTSGSGL